ncbi:MAG: hypothetical protein IPK80_14805 [Nannocystis sp.]|nr:hypothetical protein [Nannocystis sp.]
MDELLTALDVDPRRRVIALLGLALLLALLFALALTAYYRALAAPQTKGPCESGAAPQIAGCAGAQASAAPSRPPSPPPACRRRYG